MTRLPEWLGTGHERRAKLLACLAVVCLAVATAGVLAAPDRPRLTVDDEPPENNTYVALQGYQDEGRAIEVAPDGELVWEYDDTDDVFDVEALGPDRVQISTADEIPDAECPEQYRNDGFRNCVRNSLRIVEQSTNDVVWEYAWYDAELHEHELHDADHYTVAADGNETGREDRWVLVDMGNDRVFSVDRDGEILWEWNATETYDRPDGMGPEGDWTHMNDVDRLEPGVFQVSLRNFDTVVELHVENASAGDADDAASPAGRSDREVTVEPVVGPNSFSGSGGPLYEQHNPDRLADDHLLVADSEHDRVVELNADNEVVWEFGGSATLKWPRDADRQSNGHTLVTDSYNDRVVEVDENGEVVWAVETGGLPYEADRVPGEGSADRPTAAHADLAGGGRESLVSQYLGYVIALVKYVLPAGLDEQALTLLVAAVSVLGAAVEGVRWRGVSLPASLRRGSRE
ncbi:aryl-sulfate sulfotransferase [Halorussus halobius]|uniref:aryl-sulfate sulfotransferase n=1 Tax=Halorussus halobius TaxID=1710537 RepID=UPI001092B75C|nr:aryl-sulfate sulfotransferase [Halorussus halobius]